MAASAGRRGARPMNRASGEIQVEMGGSTGTVNSNTETLDNLCGLADKIWKDVMRSGVSVDDMEGTKALLDRLQKEHKEFSTSYPVVIRWMVDRRLYNRKVFKIWLRQCIKPMYKDRKEFLEVQGEYLVRLFKADNPTASSAMISRYRAEVKKSLDEDDEIFHAAKKEAEDEAAAIEKRVADERRQTLLEYARCVQAERTETQNNSGAEEICD